MGKAERELERFLRTKRARDERMRETWRLHTNIWNKTLGSNLSAAERFELYIRLHKEERDAALRSVRSVQSNQLRGGDRAKIRTYLEQPVREMRAKHWGRPQITDQLNRYWMMGLVKFCRMNGIKPPHRISEKVVRTILRDLE